MACDTLEMVTNACNSFLSEHAEIWLLSSLTDYCFEEGAKNKDYFGVAVESMAAAGARSFVIERMGAGINGNLERALRSEEARNVVRNRGRGHDLRFTAHDECASIETKMVFDCTLEKQFAVIAKDRDKLLSTRSQGGVERLFQLVFFFQLPFYDYPSGVWFSGKCWKAREKNRVGIQSQFRRLVENLPQPPRYPPDPSNNIFRPAGTCLPEVENLLSIWYPRVFRPQNDWKFDPALHLREAGASFAIWEW